jgi:gliding motility-associated-like protein
MNCKNVFLLILALLAVVDNLTAQLVNNGAKLFLDQNSLLYVDHKVVYNSGSILDHGEMIVTGNWINNNASAKPFDQKSTGSVKLRAKQGEISGLGTTNFPRVVFSGDGTFKLKSNVDVMLSLHLDNAEVLLFDSQLTLLNTIPTSLYSNTGFVNTGSNGLLVRHTQAGEDYMFPLGSSDLSLKRFVSLKPKDAGKGAFGVAFIDRDPSVNGYSRFNKVGGIQEVNHSYYHKLQRLDGTVNVDASFYTSNTESYNSLAAWTQNNWNKVAPVSKESAAIGAGLNTAFFSEAVNLPLGSAVPFAFATVSDAKALDIYNAFSPDGDGKNDTWEVKNIDAFPDNDLKIYDRSGNLIYRVNGYNSSKFWDGQNAIAGTYIYILRVKIDGSDQYFKGAVTMVKN